MKVRTAESTVFISGRGRARALISVRLSAHARIHFPFNPSVQTFLSLSRARYDRRAAGSPLSPASAGARARTRPDPAEAAGARDGEVQPHGASEAPERRELDRARAGGAVRRHGE